MVNIDEMQFAFVSGRGTNDAIFIVRQLQEKYIATVNKRLYFPSLTLRKPLLVCHGCPCGGPWGARVWTNGLCVSSRACSTMTGACAGRLLIQWRVWRRSWCASGFCPWPINYHPGTGSAVTMWQCHCRQMLRRLRKVQETAACPHLQAPLS